MKKLNKKKIALLTACVVSAVGHMAFAAEADNYDEYSGADYVVTATRTALEKKEVPNAVQVIKREEMENLGATNVLNALALANNINLSTKGMAGNAVMVRGMNTNHVLILVDGKRMADEQTSSTQNVYQLQRLSLSNIERVEIVRGAASALYGSDALGGVINIITKKSEQPQLTVGLSTGSDEVNNWYRYDFGKQGKFSGSFDMRFTDVRENNVDGNSGIYGPKQDFNFKGTWDLGNTKELELAAGYYNEHSRAKYADSGVKDGDTVVDTSRMVSLPSGMQMPTMGTFDGDQMTNVNKREWYDYKRYDYSLTYSGEKQYGDYMLRAYYSKLKKENRLFNSREDLVGTLNRFTSMANPGKTFEDIFGSNYPRYDWDKSEYVTYGVEGKETLKLSDAHTLTYGAEYRNTGAEGTRLGLNGDNAHNVTQNGVTKGYSEKDIDTVAAYVQDVWKVNDNLTLIPSVRYDHDDTFGGEASPKLGATYALSDNSRVKANWGKGYKAPTVAEMYMAMHRAMGAAVVNIYGNPDLQPEKSNSWDISFEAEKGRTTGKATYFHSKVDNLITTDSNKRYLDGYRYENISEAEIQGVELEVGQQFDANWGLKATYNYLDAVNSKTNARLSSRARQNGTVQLTYTDNKENPFSATLWSQWYQDYLYNSENYTYNLINFAVNKKINKNLRVFAGIDNIFDKRFAQNADASNFDTDGRTWRVGAEMTF